MMSLFLANNELIKYKINLLYINCFHIIEKDDISPQELYSSAF